jgi:phage terminase large subunit-like protein
LLETMPALNVTIMQYSYEKAQSSGRFLREYAKAIGVKIKEGHNTIGEWKTERGGGCVVMSVDQSRAGFPTDILLVDDPLDEHSSATQRDRDLADRQIALYTMRAGMHLDSVLIVASPWTTDDPGPRRERRGGWRVLRRPAIVDEGGPDERAFAPDVRTLDQLKEIRREYEQLDPTLRLWWAQFMCQPLPPALGFFEGEHEMLGDIPVGAPYGFGFDCAFTQGKKSDYTGVVGGALVGPELWVDFARRGKVGLTYSIQLLQECFERRPDAQFFSYASGPEVGIYHALVERLGLPLQVMPARFNKSTRAQKAAHAWREGRVRVKFRQVWTPTLLAELHAFDGSETGVDDQTDGLVSLYDGMIQCAPAEGFDGGFGFGHPVL